jgi:hypothetical protein
MDTPTLPRLLTLMDVALWLDLSVRQVRQMARRGEIPARTLPNGELVFEESALRNWLETLQTPTQEMPHAP